MGLVAMVSYSIVHRRGGEAFVEEAAQAGFDGFIFPDLPLEASGPILRRVDGLGLACSLLIAPTTPMERAKGIAQACRGFVYLLARAGITGERSDLPSDLVDRIATLRGVTDLPIAVGFGVSSPEQVRGVVEAADAAIVGSAVMRRVAQAREQGSEAVVQAVRSFVGELAGGLPWPAR
jgi:tryptophan synthase alpha chain